MNPVWNYIVFAATDKLNITVNSNFALIFLFRHWESTTTSLNNFYLSFAHGKRKRRMRKMKFIQSFRQHEKIKCLVFLMSNSLMTSGLWICRHSTPKWKHFNSSPCRNCDSNCCYFSSQVNWSNFCRNVSFNFTKLNSNKNSFVTKANRLIQKSKFIRKCQKGVELKLKLLALRETTRYDSYHMSQSNQR